MAQWDELPTFLGRTQNLMPQDNVKYEFMEALCDNLMLFFASYIDNSKVLVLYDPVFKLVFCPPFAGPADEAECTAACLICSMSNCPPFGSTDRGVGKDPRYCVYVPYTCAFTVWVPPNCFCEALYKFSHHSNVQVGPII